MPRADNEWGDWDESQYDVPPRPAWLEERLGRGERESIDSVIAPSIKEESSSPTPEEAYLPSLRDFRCWYVWARETERHEIYLQQIEALAVAFKLETPIAKIDIHLTNPNVYLSEANLHNMKNDQRSYQELLENFLRDAKTIIDSRGKNEICDGENILRYHSRNGEYVLSYYPASDQVTVIRNGYLLAYQQAGKASVGDKFVIQRDAALFKRAAIYR